MHFSEPEINFFLREAPKHPLRAFTTHIYFQKFSFNLLHIFGKILGPLPYQKILDPPLTWVLVHYQGCCYQSIYDLIHPPYP